MATEPLPDRCPLAPAGAVKAQQAVACGVPGAGRGPLRGADEAPGIRTGGRGEAQSPPQAKPPSRLLGPTARSGPISGPGNVTVALGPPRTAEQGCQEEEPLTKPGSIFFEFAALRVPSRPLPHSDPDILYAVGFPVSFPAVLGCAGPEEAAGSSGSPSQGSPH